MLGPVEATAPIKGSADDHPLRYSAEQATIERILTRRIHKNRLDGFTLETSLEILDAISLLNSAA